MSLARRRNVGPFRDPCRSRRQGLFLSWNPHPRGGLRRSRRRHFRRRGHPREWPGCHYVDDPPADAPIMRAPERADLAVAGMLAVEQQEIGNTSVGPRQVEALLAEDRDRPHDQDLGKFGLYRLRRRDREELSRGSDMDDVGARARSPGRPLPDPPKATTPGAWFDEAMRQKSPRPALRQARAGRRRCRPKPRRGRPRAGPTRQPPRVSEPRKSEPESPQDIIPEPGQWYPTSARTLPRKTQYDQALYIRMTGSNASVPISKKAWAPE